MCEETSGVQRPQRRRGQPQQHASPPRRSAIDEPPPVASPTQQWQARTIQCQSPQHLFTLQGTPSSIASPIVIDERYYCQATVNGSIQIWTVDAMLANQQEEEVTVPPQFTVNATSSTPIIQLAKGFPESGNLLALSAAGDVYVISIHCGKEPHLLFTWNTETVGASCICCTQTGTIVVGYQNGYLEAWRRIVKLQGGGWTGKLLWRSAFDLHDPIRAVEQLVPDNDNDNKEEKPENKADHDEEERDHSIQRNPVKPHNEYLILTLQPNSPSTAKMVEVVDVTAMEDAYKEITDINTLLSLENYWVLPEAGMELVDSSTLHHHDGRNGLPRRPHWIPSHGTDCLFRLRNGGCAFGLSDGTVGIISATLVDGRLSWGIAKAAYQLLLSYPCIGLGSIEMGVIDGTRRQFVSCSLRGGTNYLVPIDMLENPDPTEALPALISVSYPHDVDSDTILQHLQSCVATNFRSGKEEKDLPVLFFGWPGGVVDVCSCKLLQNEIRPPTAVLHELVENGSAALLAKILSSVDSKATDLEWIAACKEIGGSGGQVTFEELSSDKMKAFRTLLLKFACPRGSFPALIPNV